MKKFLSALTLAVTIIFATAPAQAESNFDLNTDSNSQIVFKSNLHGGRVVGVSTYLSLREQPNVNSREIMRIPNGAKLSLREDMPGDWMQVMSVTFNGQTYRNQYDVASPIGWVNIKYVQFDY